jgi:hypothetical protein
MANAAKASVPPLTVANTELARLVRNERFGIGKTVTPSRICLQEFLDRRL